MTAVLRRWAPSAGAAGAALGVSVALGVMASQGARVLALLVGIAAGLPLLAVIFRRPSVGAAAVIALFAALPMNTLFSVGVPAMGGNLKITDLLLLATFAGAGTQWLGGQRLSAASRVPVLAVLALLLLALLGVYTAHRFGTPLKLSLTDLRPLLAYVLVFPIALDVKSAAELRWGVWVFLAATAVLSAVTIWKFAHGQGSDATYTNGDIRVDGTPFALPVLALIWIVTLLPHVDRFRVRMSLYALAVVELGGVVLTFRRGGWIAGIVALVVVVVLLPGGTRRRLLFACAVACAAILVGGSLIGTGQGGPPLTSAIVQRAKSVSAAGSDLSVRYRFIEWRQDIDTIRRHPLTGIGLGSGVVFADPRYYPPAQAYDAVWSHIYLHNSFLWFAVKLGVAGVGALTLLLTWTLWHAYRLTRMARDQSAALALGVFSTLICLTVMSLTDGHFNSANITPYAAGAVGAIMFLDRRGREPRATVDT